MRVMDELYLTRDGWQQLRAELATLLKRRDEQSAEYAEIAESIEWGEAASPNVHSIAFLDRRIAELEKIISRAVPVSPEARHSGRVGVGSRALVRWEDGDEESLMLVGPPEVDVASGRISYQSPVGQALMGKCAGDSVQVATPGGPRVLRLLEVK